MTIYQIIVIFISSYFIVDRIKKRIAKEPRQSFLKVTTTIVLWSTVILVTLIPEIFDHVVTLVGLEKNGNSVLGIVLIFLLILFFKMLSIIERIENNITELVRKEALKNLEKKI